jgi:hypothetical protein
MYGDNSHNYIDNLHLICIIFNKDILKNIFNNLIFCNKCHKCHFSHLY